MYDGWTDRQGQNGKRGDREEGGRKGGFLLIGGGDKRGKERGHYAGGSYLFHECVLHTSQDMQSIGNRNKHTQKQNTLT